MPVGNGNGADASLIMADQEMAAKLNMANGSPVVAGLNDSLASADALIGNNLIPMKVKPNTPLGRRMIAVAAFLSNYNSGSLTTGCGQALITKAANEIEMNPLQLRAHAVPNPSARDFAITINTEDLIHQISLQVTDLYGRVIEKRTVTPNSITRIGDKYNEGVYIVTIRQDKNQRQIKLVKTSGMIY